MTEPNHQPTPDILERAAEALRTAPVPPGPSADLLAATVADSRSYQRRRRMFRYIRFGSASAALAAAITLALVFWPSPSPAMVLEKAAENTEKASSLRAVVTLDPGQGQKKLEVKLYQQGDSMRIESADPGLVVVVNGKEQKGLVLLPQMKAAWFLDPRTDPTVSNVMKRVSGATKMMGRPLKEGKFTVLPDETLDGRKVKVYERKGVKVPDLKGEGDLKVWIDPKRLLPVRAEVRLQQGNKTVTATLNVLGWSEELDPKLFEMTVPKGYKVIEQPEPPKKGDKPEPRESEPEAGPAQFILFRRAMDNADKAKSVRVRTKLQSGGKVTLEQKGYRLGDLIRSETTTVPMSNGFSVTIADLKTREVLQLNPQDKTARRTTLGRQEARMVSGLLGSFADIKEQLAGGRESAVRDLGFEKLGDRRVNVYEVVAQTPPAGIWRIWVDPKTNLPVRLVAGDKNKITVTFEFEAWNEELDPKLFSLDVPKGYTVEGDKKPTPPESEPETGPAQFVLFRRAMDNADKAKSVRVIHKTNRYGKWATESTEYYQGNRVRAEVGAILVVADGTAKKRLELNTATKTARLRDMTEPELREHKRQQLNWLTEPLQPLRHLQDDKDYTVRELPPERQNSRLVKVYQIDHTAGGKTDRRIKLSVDAKTELPIRARIEGAKAETNPLSSDALMNRNRPPTTIIEYEDWNKEFDAKLFSLEVPKGYRISDHPLEDTAPPPERTIFVLFRRAMDDAEKAKSFRAAVHTTMTNAPAGAPKEIEQKLFSQGDKMRIEFGDTMVSVADATAKKMLLLNRKAKTAQTMPLNGPPSDLQKSVTAAVKKVIDRKEGVEDLGEKFLDGRKTHAYRVKGLSLGGMKADVTYWIDAKRDLPVRLEMKTAGPVTMTQRIDYLGFNEELDPKLFEMAAPKGYKVVEKPK